MHDKNVSYCANYIIIGNSHRFLPTKGDRAGLDANSFDLKLGGWRQEIQPFGCRFGFEDRFSRPAVKLQLPAVQLGTLGDLLGRHIIGFEIDYDKALRRLNQHVNDALNDE